MFSAPIPIVFGGTTEVFGGGNLEEGEIPEDEVKQAEKSAKNY